MLNARELSEKGKFTKKSSSLEGYPRKLFTSDQLA
jgi:hypothetical protein